MCVYICVCVYTYSVCVTIVIKKRRSHPFEKELRRIWEHLKNEKERKIKKRKERKKKNEGKEEIMYSYFNCSNL